MDELIKEIRELWRRRTAWHKAEKRLILQCKGTMRRWTDGDRTKADALYAQMLKVHRGKIEPGPGLMEPYIEIAPLISATLLMRKEREALEKHLETLAQQLPVAKWVEPIRGVAWLYLAGIVGSAGDLRNYDNPAKLWKRMGVACMPDGTRQRRVAGIDAIAHGYDPEKRALIWNLGENIVKQNFNLGPDGKANKEDPQYFRLVFDEKKAEIAALNESGAYAEQAEKLVKNARAYGRTPPPENLEGRLTKKHINDRAKRYAAKRFLRELWVAWKACAGGHVGVETQRGSAAPHAEQSA